MGMKPEEMARKTQHIAKSMRAMRGSHVVVGLPIEGASSRVYPSGVNVLQVAVWHEYGFGNNPQRSFLRMPFMVEREKLAATIGRQWDRVVDGADPEQALGLIGAQATNISKAAFTSAGYGNWPDITEARKREKGSSQILVDNAILRNSITWAVR